MDAGLRPDMIVEKKVIVECKSNTTADFFRAGVSVVGVGGELVNQKLLDGRDFKTITELAQAFRRLADEGRGK